MSNADDRALVAIERVHMLVRSHPQQLVSLEDAAREAAYSPSRFHALFQERYGETFGAFVRRVRLQFACNLMRAKPDWSCTQIAFESGYSESSDFTRSFRRSFGLPPSQWDRVRPLVIFDSNKRNRQAGEQPPSYMAHMQAEPGISKREWNVRIENRNSQNVAVLAVPNAEKADNLRAAWDRFEDWLGHWCQIREDRRMMGLSYDSIHDTQGDVFRFELAYPIDESVSASDGIATRMIPKTQAAVVSCQGGIDAFTSAWDHLKRVFLPDSCWEVGEGPTAEVYYDDPRSSGMTEWNMDCIMPIQKSDGK